MTTYKWRTALAFGGILLALAGCAEAKKSTDVASLQSSKSGATTAQPGSGSQTGRPQRRLDMTAEEEQRLWQAYHACLGKEDPSAVGKSAAGPAGASPDYVNPEVASKESLAACKVKLPLLAPELDAEKNPDYKDDMHKNIQCLNRKGLKVVETADGWSYNGPVTMSPAQQQKVGRECRLEAFGGGRN